MTTNILGCQRQLLELPFRVCAHHNTPHTYQRKENKNITTNNHIQTTQVRELTSLTNYTKHTQTPCTITVHHNFRAGILI